MEDDCPRAGEPFEGEASDELGTTYVDPEECPTCGSRRIQIIG